MIKQNVTFFLVLGFVFSFVLVKQAHAYLDPGTGSYLFQFLIAGALGGTYFLRGYIVKIKDKVLKKKTDAKKTDEPTKKKN